MSKKNILVVDDEPLIGSSLQEALRRWDYDVTLVEDGRKACFTGKSGVKLMGLKIRTICLRITWPKWREIWPTKYETRSAA